MEKAANRIRNADVINHFQKNNYLTPDRGWGNGLGEALLAKSKALVYMDHVHPVHLQILKHPLCNPIPWYRGISKSTHSAYLPLLFTENTILSQKKYVMNVVNTVTANGFTCLYEKVIEYQAGVEELWNQNHAPASETITIPRDMELDVVVSKKKQKSCINVNVLKAQKAAEQSATLAVRYATNLRLNEFDIAILDSKKQQKIRTSEELLNVTVTPDKPGVLIVVVGMSTIIVSETNEAVLNLLLALNRIKPLPPELEARITQSVQRVEDYVVRTYTIPLVYDGKSKPPRIKKLPYFDKRDPSKIEQKRLVFLQKPPPALAQATFEDAENVLDYLKSNTERLEKAQEELKDVIELKDLRDKRVQKGVALEIVPVDQKRRQLYDVITGKKYAGPVNDDNEDFSTADTGLPSDHEGLQLHLNVQGLATYKAFMKSGLFRDIEKRIQDPGVWHFLTEVLNHTPTGGVQEMARIFNFADKTAIVDLAIANRAQHLKKNGADAQSWEQRASIAGFYQYMLQNRMEA